MPCKPLFRNALLLGFAALLFGCSDNPKAGSGSATTPSSEKAKEDYTVTPEVSASVVKLAEIMQQGYSILDTVTGDLNLDAYPDKILILKKNGEDTISGSPRPLIILTGAEHLYKLEARNDSVVLCRDCGGVFGDPYEHITIKKGYFSIEHYGGSSWRWTRVITFKYLKDRDRWVLHRDAGVSYHTSDPDKQENIITGKEDFDKLPFEKFSYEKGQ